MQQTHLSLSLWILWTAALYGLVVVTWSDEAVSVLSEPRALRPRVDEGV